MNLSKFSRGINLLNKVVDTKKVVTSSDPQLILTPSKDKFTLNQKAMEALGLEIGDKVVMMDMNKGVNDKSQLVDSSERFLIAKNIYDVDDKKGKIGKTLSFSYVGVYSAVLADDKEKTVLTTNELIGRGLMIARKVKSGTSYIATKKVTMDLVAIPEPILISGAANAEPQQVFVLTNLVRREYTAEEIAEVTNEIVTNEVTE